MSSSDVVRWGAVSFVLGGVARIALTLALLAIGPRAGLGSFVPVMYILAVLFLIGGVVGLHALQKNAYGRIGRAGFYTVIVSSVAQILGLVVLLAGSEALVWLLSIGPLGVLVGFALYGAATLQARVLPRWCGVAFIIALPITILLGVYGGNIWLGLIWLALG